MRLIVCGGRDYDDVAFVYSTLDRIHAKRKLDAIIQGGATGADMLAKRWASDRGVECIEVAANWDSEGRAAGPLRNGRMLAMQPDGVVAFPGGRGTADMCRQASAFGVRVWFPAQVAIHSRWRN